jgi:hypothetical protein
MAKRFSGMLLVIFLVFSPLIINTAIRRYKIDVSQELRALGTASILAIILQVTPSHLTFLRYPWFSFSSLSSYGICDQVYCQFSGTTPWILFLHGDCACRADQELHLAPL